MRECKSIEIAIRSDSMSGAMVAPVVPKRTDVVVVERGHIASGATGHSGALVRQHYEARLGIRLARESLEFFQRFAAETGFSCDFRTTGFLSGARTRDLPAFEALLGLLQQEGVRVVRLTPEEARTVEPSLDAADYAALVYDPDAGYADPIATATGLARAAERRGAIVREGCAVRSIVTKRKNVTGVRISGGGLIETERVVLAADNWTASLARPLGVRLPIRFVRGDVSILRRPIGF